MNEKVAKVRKEKGIRVGFRSGWIDVEMNLSISRERATIFLLLLVVIILLMVSALSEDTRKFLIEVLLGALQLLVADHREAG